MSIISLKPFSTEFILSVASRRGRPSVPTQTLHLFAVNKETLPEKLGNNKSEKVPKSAASKRPAKESPPEKEKTARSKKVKVVAVDKTDKQPKPPSKKPCEDSGVRRAHAAINPHSAIGKAISQAQGMAPVPKKSNKKRRLPSSSKSSSDLDSSSSDSSSNSSSSESEWSDDSSYSDDSDSESDISNLESSDDPVSVSRCIACASRHKPKKVIGGDTKRKVKNVLSKAFKQDAYDGSEKESDFLRYVFQTGYYLEDCILEPRRIAPPLALFLTGKGLQFYEQRVASRPEKWSDPQKFYLGLHNFFFPPNHAIKAKTELERASA